MSKSQPQMIIGFDILPQSSPSAQKKPRFAIAIIYSDHIETSSSVSRSELLRIIRKQKPNILATDNLFELSSTEKGVIDFLSKIPSKTRVIQVTGSPKHGMTPLLKLARRNGFNVQEHPKAIETAILIGKLAALGVGTEVSVLARETRIIISRARTIGPGGFSQGRYQRRMQGAILQVTRNILERLSKAGLDFDHYETRSTHGLARCIIHVYESYDNISNIIHSEVNRLAGVSVRLSPVKHRAILYLPREEETKGIVPRRQLVVGIDAGITVGIAVADVTGQLIALHSGRGMSRGDVIRYLVELGSPILVTTDVTPAPNFVEKLSNSLKTALFTPRRVLSVVGKRELAKSFAAPSELRPANAHQRDALAAVAQVFQTFGSKLQILNDCLFDKGKLQVASKAAALVLQGFSVSDAIEQSISSQEHDKELIAPPKPVSPAKEQPSPKDLERTIARLKRQIDTLQRQLEFEREKNQESIDQQQKQETELIETKRQLDRVLSQEHREQRRDERIRQKEKEISRLHKEIANLRKEQNSLKNRLINLKLMRHLEISGEVQPVLMLPHFSQEEIRQLSEKITKKRGQLVYILDPSGGGATTAEQLIRLGVRVVITKGTMSHLALQRLSAANIPVIKAETLRITIVDEFAVVDINQLEQRVREWMQRHNATEREAAAESLERLVEEYRQERRTEDAG
jgi:predicted RNase H-like nuclease (RuvC/YqgF family)